MNQNDQLELKMLYERRVRPEIRRLFNRIRFDFRVGVATGQQVSAIKYKPEWETLISNHYRRVQNGFRGAINGNEKQEDDSTLDELIIIALLAWAAKNAPMAANRITDTTQENMNAAITQARQAFSDEGRTDYSSRELATASAVILGRRFKGREETIATTETQSAAESTKQIEAYALAGLPAMAAVTGARVPPSESVKVWKTMGDKRVRLSHRQADGQRRPLEQPFFVKRQQLMFPGDNSMGATIDNTINCRCSALYIFK